MFKRKGVICLVCFVCMLASCNSKNDTSTETGWKREIESILSEETEEAEEAPKETEEAGEAPKETEEAGEAAKETEKADEVAQETGTEEVQGMDASQTEEQGTETSEELDWKLLLVNATHPIPEGYAVRLKEVSEGQFVDVRIWRELQQMFEDARADGIYPTVRESFRTAQRQQEIMDSYIASYEAAGASHENAVAKALKIVAVPGTSEHQLGLAIDVNTEKGAGAKTATWKWFRENCARYGFILRYPEDKTKITGISYEPWHFRYVGVEAATEIMEQGICLEEYLGEE